MPRTLVLGNGNILINFDQFAQVKDFYFPYVGVENHVDHNNPHRVGIFVDGNFTWLNDGSWDITMDYKKDTMAGRTQARHSSLGIRIQFDDVVYNEKNIFIRKLQVYNNRHEDRVVKVFLSQEFQGYGSPLGNTTFMDVKRNALFHYKGQRVFLVSGMTGEAFFDDYTTGAAHSKGMEGTWRDAEDGKLEKNPVDHGSVDSTIGFTLNVKARSYRTLYYWVAVGKSLEETYQLHTYVTTLTPQHLITSTINFWNAWARKREYNFYGLSEKAADLYYKSLLIIRTHADNRGGIIASSDSDILQGGFDSYNYVWPRDAALIAMSLDKAGYKEISKKFFEFCTGCLRESGYLMHKYHPNGALGSSWHSWINEGHYEVPLQEDETALTLLALWRHYEVERDLEFVESIYNAFIKKTADFMCAFIEEELDLPRASYDLWEEKLGIHTFTVATVYAALIAAANFSDILGKQRMVSKYIQMAKRLKKGLLERLYDSEKGYFIKRLYRENGKWIADNTIDASSVFGMFYFDVLPPDDPRVTSAMKLTIDTLFCRTKSGGLARRTNDAYFKDDQTVQGNPWFITTLWVAQYHIRTATKPEELDPVKEIIEWCVRYTMGSGIMSEQIHPQRGTPVSVAPLIWSHSTFVLTIIEYLEKLESFGVGDIHKPVRTRFL